jgi:hypothetical protein
LALIIGHYAIFIRHGWRHYAGFRHYAG